MRKKHRQTDKQTNKQTNKRRYSHDTIGVGIINPYAARNMVDFWYRRQSRKGSQVRTLTKQKNSVVRVFSGLNPHNNWTENVNIFNNRRQ